MQEKIEKLDSFGRGITHIDGKITFVPKTVPGDVVDIEVTKSKKNYNEAKVCKIVTPSIDRIPAKCPFYNVCGGCHLQNLSYENTVKYKLDNVINKFSRAGIKYPNIEFIKNTNEFNYRNKISLKIVDKKIGFYESGTHKLTEISGCLLASDAINKMIKSLPLLNITNGSVTISSNYNDEILLAFDTHDEVKNIPASIANDNKLVGIVLNNKTIYGENHFMEFVNGLFFEVSYDSFFQVNRYVASRLFDFVKESVSGENVLDLYSGVGTLTLNSAKKAKQVIGIEIVKNAVINALKNKKINKLDNIEFLLHDLSKTLNIKDDFDTIIIDPPRNGIDNKTMNFLKEKNPQTIICVSCNIDTFIRDIKLLENYKIEKLVLFDMFSYTYHVECGCILNRR